MADPVATAATGDSSPELANPESEKRKSTASSHLSKNASSPNPQDEPSLTVPDHDPPPRRDTRQLRRWLRRLKRWNMLLFRDWLGIVFGLPLLVPLILYAKDKPDIEGQCQPRVDGCGFSGNEDAYGLGIRLGVYLQWLSLVVTTFYLPAEESGLIATIAIFGTAVLIATVVLTFDKECTYSIEIVVMLFIVFGNEFLISMTRTARAVYRDDDDDDGDDEAGESLTSATGPVRAATFMSAAPRSKRRKKEWHGLTMGTTMLDIVAGVYAVWFWMRMAIGIDDTFAETPCGTSLFALGRVRGSGVGIYSGFLAGVSILLIVTPLSDWATSRLLPKGTKDYVTQGLAVLAVLVPGALLYLCYQAGRLFVKVYYPWRYDAAVAEEKMERYDGWLQEGDNAENGIYGTMIALIVGVCIAGIELSLLWNGVSDVYGVLSTGQLIPLAIGVFSFAPIFWSMGRDFIEKLLLDEPA